MTSLNILETAALYWTDRRPRFALAVSPVRGPNTTRMQRSRTDWPDFFMRFHHMHRWKIISAPALPLLRFFFLEKKAFFYVSGSISCVFSSNKPFFNGTMPCVGMCQPSVVFVFVGGLSWRISPASCFLCGTGVMYIRW